MITSIEVVDLLYKFLAKSEIKSLINGDIHKYERPNNSKKEDIVVGSIAVTSGSVQPATLNVNIHVPTKKVKINGETQYQPDTARMRELSKKLIEIFRGNKGVYLDDVCSCWISNQTDIKEPNIDQWYTNNRVEIRYHNT